MSVVHSAPDMQDGTLVACGKGTVAAVYKNKDLVSAQLPDTFLDERDDDTCLDCVRELTAKAARDDTPTSGGVLTSELPKSQPEAPFLTTDSGEERSPQ